MTIRSKSRFLMGAMAVLLVCPGVAQAQFGEGAPPGSPGREIIHLTGDLYRFRDVRHYGMFLHTPEGIILVDPTNPGTAAWLKGELDSRFDVPVRYVIYSHAHNDHAAGGEVFAETATFVAHENMARSLVQPSDGAPLLPLEARSDANGNGSIEESEAAGPFANNFAAFDLDGNGSLSRPHHGFSEQLSGPSGKPIRRCRAGATNGRERPVHRAGGGAVRAPISGLGLYGARRQIVPLELYLRRTSTLERSYVHQLRCPGEVLRSDARGRDRLGVLEPLLGRADVAPS